MPVISMSPEDEEKSFIIRGRFLPSVEMTTKKDLSGNPIDAPENMIDFPETWANLPETVDDSPEMKNNLPGSFTKILETKETFPEIENHFPETVMNLPEIENDFPDPLRLNDLRGIAHFLCDGILPSNKRIR